MTSRTVFGRCKKFKKREVINGSKQNLTMGEVITKDVVQTFSLVRPPEADGGAEGLQDVWQSSKKKQSKREVKNV